MDQIINSTFHSKNPSLNGKLNVKIKKKKKHTEERIIYKS